MSAAKRSRQQQSGAAFAPASKRIKTTNSSHVPAKSGLAFLVDDNAHAGKKLDAKLTNGVPWSKAAKVDESHAQVAADVVDYDGVNGREEDVMSGEESSEEEDDEDEEEEEAVNGAHRLLVDGHASDDENADETQLGAQDDRMEGVEGDGAQEEVGEPSFGDMLQARHPEPISVHAADSKEKTAVIAASKIAGLQLSGTSLATVVKQALRTNDRDQLEACFAITDLPSIRSSIQRLESQYAAQLLQRLSERMHRKPGRAGNLMIWVQWTLVTHGGYLSTQPDSVKRLRSLSQVVRARASGLQPLLHLKGKLDLLNSQLELRRNLHAESKAAQVSEDNEDAVLYVDGQDDDWSDDEDVDMGESGAGYNPIQMPTPKARGTIDVDDSEEGENSGEDLHNGVAQEADESEDNDEEQEGMFDEEAEETSNDEGDDESDEEEDSAPQSEEDEEQSDDESEPEVIAPQPKTLNRKR
ncbi:Dip2/Utp12 Family [Teratosphaeria destructans]|uniref:Dip2/Utp12 Family n=1 Tax=Teratosphaeria destructans TaxID=418781 RepID=A0A9W7W297_9PEZI|nr:Dip2/Utp12 Family [Teratosphaeria destructans]